MAVTLGIILDVRPSPESSFEHPLVTFCTTAAMVSLLQAGAPHRLVSQLLIGVTMDEFAPPAMIETRETGLRHAAASGLVAMPVKALEQLVEIL